MTTFTVPRNALIFKDGPVQFKPAEPIVEERFRQVYPDLIERVCRQPGCLMTKYSKTGELMAKAKRVNNLILFTLVKRDKSGLINQYIII